MSLWNSNFGKSEKERVNTVRVIEQRERESKKVQRLERKREKKRRTEPRDSERRKERKGEGKKKERERTPNFVGGLLPSSRNHVVLRVKSNPPTYKACA